MTCKTNYFLKNKKMKISVIWTWYVWLIQAVWLADLWFEITALDVFQDKIDLLKSWVPTIYENWLEELLNKNLKNINFTTNKQEISWSDIIFLCVWTPQDEEWKTDLWYIFWACDDLKNILKWNEIIIIKSTVPVGTNKKIYDFFWWKNHIVSNPEFLREWLAIQDFFNPDRIVLWFNKEEKEEVKQKVFDVYKYFSQKNVNILSTNWETAELIKYAANSFLATKITFINEIARLSDSVWADVKDIACAIWMDKRIWKDFLNAWIWYGWSCFPKDVKSLIHQFSENNLSWEIIKKVDETNSSQVNYFTKKIFDFYQNQLHSKTISILWVAFKPDTDDLRESKWLEIVKKLLYSWVKLKVYDYNKKALENFDKYTKWLFLANSRGFFPIEICNNFDDLIKNSDSLVITLEDKNILKEDLNSLTNLNDKVIFDGKNILNKKDILNIWIKYFWVWY